MIGTLISVIHFFLVVFLILAPFSGSPYLISLHFLVVPFIMLHWITNQTVCALTEMEKLVRGTTNDDETFFGKVVGPVYRFKRRGDEQVFVWTVLVTLWFVSAVQLHDSKFAYLRAELARVRAAYSSSS